MYRWVWKKNQGLPMNWIKLLCISFQHRKPLVTIFVLFFSLFTSSSRACLLLYPTFILPTQTSSTLNLRSVVEYYQFYHDIHCSYFVLLTLFRKILIYSSSLISLFSTHLVLLHSLLLLRTWYLLLEYYFVAV